MAKIGLKFPVAAVINGYGADGKPTYNQGFIIGKAISAEKSIESNDNQLYGDDAIAESDTSFAGGSVKLGVTDFGDNYNESLQIQGKLLGQAVTTVEGGGYRIRRSALTVAPYVGFGFYKTKKHKNKLVYEATWLYKTVFKTPSESTTTKGKSIEWQTPELSYTIMKDDSAKHMWKRQADFTNEADAELYIKNILSIIKFCIELCLIKVFKILYTVVYIYWVYYTDITILNTHRIHFLIKIYIMLF